MTLAFKGDTIITIEGKKIIFWKFAKVDGKTVGCFDINGTFYPLSQIVY
jgi:hypothetical protein